MQRSSRVTDLLMFGMSEIEEHLRMRALVVLGCLRHRKNGLSGDFFESMPS